jgi:hypothetical protein
MPIRWTRGRNCAAPVPMRVHGALTEPLPSETLAQILPQDQPLTDTRRRYSGVRKLGERLHLTLDGPLSGSSPASLASARAPLSELFPWLLPHVHELAPGLWSGLGHSGRGIAAATVAGRDLARRVLGRPECEITFPLTWLRPMPNRTAGPRRGRNHCCLPHPRSARCVA